MEGNVGPETHASDPGLLWRRITDRIRQLGLTEEAVAQQAGMSTRYLRQLAAVGTDFDPQALYRVAAALGTTTQELLEGRADPPPGQAGGAPRPVLTRLTEAECWDRLGPQGVGRVILPAEPAPVAFPVNYAVDAKTVVYRTALQGAAAPEGGTVVSFEVDRIDDRTHGGWSVLVAGAAERIEDAEEVRRLARECIVEPWAGGDRPAWIRVRPDSVSGRRIGAL
ncbi:Nitroimidazol reductase NimA, pyridoxamine 5'-phosphate oxidase superfamily [Actinacidiphila yanglinensis]|uniref:Nitroimidazol reductase NimA, pyridoxamine 5'-phosphate oxidase superfamily n=1 Tax=Actinacidiphila yanglinensis TaxID=310779 RepID=A0A1H6D7I7_9ACTN|nr:pyridoxamine 5'-phosphate oxidase family protein [Actinacidiphila yanglinensis]SEG81252.1 Nitroimidazol reductase NimA, pyridoxamine 5'-phosphate oxidase superfamily [Actinacidiphila yanglinensis]